MSYVVLENVTKSYDGAVILGPIDRSFDKGQFVTLLGPSGCGKSTLLRCIAGLIPLSGGRISVDGEDITRTPPQKRGIGMVFQNYALFPNMTVRENVAFGLEMRNVAAPERVKRVKEALELVELASYGERYPSQLSGGQMQRVALARSLVTRPRILLLDEPLSALDARIRRALRDQIRAIQKELGLTTLFVTHDQEEALTVSDRIVLMHAGHIEQDGRPEELYSRPVSRFAVEFIGFRNIFSPSQARNVLGVDAGSQVSLRPENIHVCRGSGSQSQVMGRVVSRMLLGNVVRYQLSVDNMPLVMDTLNCTAQGMLSDGDTVPLSFDRSEIHAVE